MIERQQYYQHLEYMLVFFVSFLFLTFWQFHLSFGDPDAFYHAKMAELLSQGILLRALPWMQFTSLSQHFTDHHLLYHLLLAPFMKLGNPLYGIKLATILFGAGFFTVFYWFIRLIAPRLSLIWTALLLVTPAFAFRISLVKDNSASLIVVLLILACLLKRKSWWIFILQIIYVWLYGGWILGLMLAGLYGLVDAVAAWRQRTDTNWWKRLSGWSLVWASLAGSIVGIILNPYWPYNLYFYWQQIIEIAVINYGVKLQAGAEWLSLGWLQLINFHLYPGILMIVGLICGYQGLRRLHRNDWFLVILAFVSLLLTWKSRRYIELSAPLLYIGAAIIWQRCLSWFSWSWISQQVKLRSHWGWVAKIYLLVVIIIIAPLFIFLVFRDVLGIRQEQSQSSFTLNEFSDETRWLQDHTEKGDIIFQADWDYWPALFYYDMHNYFIVGLDPTFMYDYQPAAFQLWSSISQGNGSGDIAKVIKEAFHSRYVFVGNDRDKFIKQLDADKQFTLRYQGPFAKIYEISQ